MKTQFQSRFPQVRIQVHRQLEGMTTEAAKGLRDSLAAALNDGALPIQSDTKALAASLYVKSTGMNDYEERLAEAHLAYVGSPSKHAAGVQAMLTPAAYSDEHFAERVQPDEPRPEKPGTVVAAVCTMLAYGLFWEMGHSNLYTKREEHRPWMLPLAAVW